jgi:hypothetical protein
MGNFTKREKEILIALVSDCINYGFTEKEALSYIKARLGKEISKDAYYRRKKIVDSGSYTKEYLSYFTRVGFVVKHQQIIEIIEMIQKDAIRDYLVERDKPEEIRNKNEIRQLRFEIRENAKLLQDLSLGTPIIAQIKAKIDQLQQQNAQMV